MPEESEIPALRPPAWAEKYDYHWIFWHNGKATPFLWRNNEWNSPYGGLFSPIEAHCAGFVYSHPADPSARVIDPENAAMVGCAARGIRGRKLRRIKKPKSIPEIMIPHITEDEWNLDVDLAVAVLTALKEMP